MRRAASLITLVALLCGSLYSGPMASAQTATDWATYVDPLIGTYPPGFVNPGPVLPYGMVGLGPDTEGPLNYGGYFFINNNITGFSHIHMSAGVPRGGQIPIMPVTGDVQLGDQVSQFPEASPVPSYLSPFDHATEVAEAGYYKATLARYATIAELTATERVGVHRYTFPPGQPASIVFDPSRDLTGYNSNASIKIEDDGFVTGHVEAERSIDVYFAATFSRPITTAKTFTGTTLSDATEATGSRSGAVIGFGSDGGPVVAKVGISFVDVEGARKNIEAEVPGWDFDAVRTAARASWNEALGRIEVESDNVADLTSFYTALYHAQLFPNILSDADGRYMGFDDVVHRSDRTHYSQFSLWDSYRGQNQLLAVINPEAYEDMTLSLLDMYRQGGQLPRWTFANKDPAHMSGDPVIPFIGEGWCRGVLDDLSVGESHQLFNAMRALTNNRPENYDTLGYGSVPKPGSWPSSLQGGSGRTGTTLEWGLAEFALALMADDSERIDDRDFLKDRSLYYRNLLDTEDTDWIRPRHDDGSWLAEFLPENGYGFQEGTSWQYSWLVMQDLAGLIERMGGNTVVQDRLDKFFNLPASAGAPIAWPKVQNQATVFGIFYYGNQYAPGNEHDLEAPFVYNYAGAPWKTQAAARAAASVYSPTPDGLPGNDDLGALSGWLVWTMLGIYPITPGAPVYTVASPVFDRAVVHLADGEDLTIDAPGTTYASKYVQSVSLDGEPVTKTWLTHSDISEGATLSFEMGPVPNLEWGTSAEAAPPSISTDGFADFDCTADFKSHEEDTP